MLSALNFLGRMKWPSIVAVSLVPALSFPFWVGFDDPRPMRIYGPETIGPVVAVLSHDARQPPAPGESTRWCARLCAECGDRLERIDVAYTAGGHTPDARLAEPEEGQLCAQLDWPAGSSVDGVIARLTARDGSVAMHRWPLDRSPID